jgi:hypothetical protein
LKSQKIITSDQNIEDDSKHKPRNSKVHRCSMEDVAAYFPILVIHRSIWKRLDRTRETALDGHDNAHR